MMFDYSNAQRNGVMKYKSRGEERKTLVVEKRSFFEEGLGKGVGTEAVSVVFGHLLV